MGAARGLLGVQEHATCVCSCTIDVPGIWTYHTAFSIAYIVDVGSRLLCLLFCSFVVRGKLLSAEC